MSRRRRVGLVGLGRQGFFLLERLVTNDEIDLVIAYDCEAEARSVASSLGVAIASSFDDLLATAELDIIVLTVPVEERLRVGLRLLEAGHNTIVPVPVATSVREAESLYAAAERLGGRMTTWSHGRDDADFGSALATVRSGQLGALRVLRFEHWERMVLGAEAADRSPIKPFIRMFDQLTALVDAPAASVFVRPIDGGGMTAVVSFRAGPIASLTLNIAAATRIDQGWAIDGQSGGYAKGRRSVLTTEGEIYDLPAESVGECSFEDVLTDNAGENRIVVPREESLRLVALLAAASRSLETGCPIEVDAAV